jgi:TPR repeat protein
LVLGTAVHPRMLITGRGIPPLDGEAAIAAGVRGYLRLAHRGDRDAQAELGYLYAVGLGVPQSAESAAYWYEQAGAQNHRDAALSLAAMYALGRGVPQDDRMAFTWLQRSSDLHFLADAYACGLGVEQDFDRARLWYEVRATGGSAEAQYQLGTMYLQGCGAPHDDNLAREWLAKAADMGHPEAQVALSEMMSEGWGSGGPDPWTAYVMADLAWTRLPDEDPSRARALAARDRAAASLSPEEQENARQAVLTLVAEYAKRRTQWLKDHQRVPPRE